MLTGLARFDINNRTKHDASISSGLAIMACNRNLYTPSAPSRKAKLNLHISRYKQDGYSSSIIKK